MKAHISLATRTEGMLVLAQAPSLPILEFQGHSVDELLDLLAQAKMHTIKDADGTPYLTRFILERSKERRVFLHKIWREDQDRDLHNHPWPEAKSLILQGGYEEYRVGLDEKYKQKTYNAEFEYRAGDVSNLLPDMYHKITMVYPDTWTLFVAGERSREWGFLFDGKHVDYREYLGLSPDAEPLED